MPYTREQLLAEAQRRGLSAPKTPSFSREQLMAEAQRRGLSVPPATAMVAPSAQPTQAAEFQADVPPMDPTAMEAWQAQYRGPAKPEPTIGQKIVGAGETALAAMTGATGGTAGMLSGTALGVIEAIKRGELGSAEGADMIERMASEGAERLTYAPRTAAGQEMASELGKAAAPLAALGPVVPPGVLQGVGAPARAAQYAHRKALRFAKKSLRGESADAPEVPPGSLSVGAEEVGQAQVRQQLAGELPVPIKLTKGQRERGFEQQQFERETAKLPEGEALRERFADQNVKLQQNLDSFLDQTGAEAFELRDIGLSVDKAIRGRASRDKKNIRDLYKQAEDSGEMRAPVDLPKFVQHLNDSAPEAEVANVLKAIRLKAVKIGAAQEAPDGTLVPGALSLKDAEGLRRSINAATNAEPTNIRQASIMKGLIDEDTETAGGDVYAKARGARRRFSENYEDIGAIKRLIGSKRGSQDRAVALEDVLNDTIFKSPLDSLRHVRRILQTEGDAGKQAWRDVQGGIMTHIRNQATDNMQIDQAGNRVVSPAKLNKVITQLDKSGKLEFIFSKKGAEQLRTVNEVSQDLLTSPPGSVNYSNTVSALTNALDTLGTFATTGIPVPAVSVIRHAAKKLKTRKTHKRVKEALN